LSQIAALLRSIARRNTSIIVEYGEGSRYAWGGLRSSSGKAFLYPLVRSVLDVLINASRNTGLVFGMEKTNIGKWLEKRSATSLCSWPEEAVALCMRGHFGQVGTTLLFPAAPMGQVFWIRRARARRKMIELRLNIMRSV
jgi:hypothetical protein